MLKNIPKLITPELLKVLCQMGHGDEIVIADGNFPSCSVNDNVIRLDGQSGCDVLKAVLKLIPLDPYQDNTFLMQVTPGDKTKTPIWQEYNQLLSIDPAYKGYNTIERFDFYKRAKNAFAVIATGESALYANIILKKGVITN